MSAFNYAAIIYSITGAITDKGSLVTRKTIAKLNCDQGIVMGRFIL
jgi:hypothetical protein